METRDPQTHAIIGAAMTVHSELGRGFLESVYQEALALEMDELDIPYEREVIIPVFYKGHKLNSFFRADFICFGEVVLELKAISTTTKADEAQIINSIKATQLQRGLLTNFGSTRLQYFRRVLGYEE
ncbi:MAG: GxxExxY protein [Flavobacteriales bacterium]|nr:GxxExxY protein [Flavobacteriales bacterium]